MLITDPICIGIQNKKESLQTDKKMQIYKSKPENRSGQILLLVSFIAIVLTLLIIFSERETICCFSRVSDIVIFLVLIVLVCVWILFILDEAIWQIWGKEECSYDNQGIIVTKYRMIKKRKYIPWDAISSVSPYSPSRIWKVMTYFTISGTTQDKILIRYGNGKKFICGTNLNRIQQHDVLGILQTHVANHNR